jgi:Uma2 family endonuclease
LYSCLYEWLKEQNRNNVFIGTDQFFAWVPDQPLIRVSPDVYLLNDPPQILPDSWQTWLPGHNPPCLAFEIVSKGNWRKDYQDIQQKYAQLGVEELVIFDPIIAANRNLKTKKRSALQLFRRTTDGSFRKIYAGNNSIYCQELGAWLVIVEKFLRISRNQAGTNLVPTVEESEERERVAKELALKAKEKERNAKEKERKAKEKERKAKEQEQLARQNAERLLVEAQAEITRLKRLLGQNNT